MKELESKCTNPDCTAERAHSGPCPPKNFGEFLRTKLNDRPNHYLGRGA